MTYRGDNSGYIMVELDLDPKAGHFLYKGKGWSGERDSGMISRRELPSNASDAHFDQSTDELARRQCSLPCLFCNLRNRLLSCSRHGMRSLTSNWKFMEKTLMGQYSANGQTPGQ